MFTEQYVSIHAHVYIRIYYMNGDSHSKLSSHPIGVVYIHLKTSISVTGNEDSGHLSIQHFKSNQQLSLKMRDHCQERLRADKIGSLNRVSPI